MCKMQTCSCEHPLMHICFIVVKSSDEDLFGDDTPSSAGSKRKKPSMPVVALADTGIAVCCRF